MIAPDTPTHAPDTPDAAAATGTKEATKAPSPADAYDGLVLGGVYEVCLALVGIAALLTAIRLVRGPTLADRVVAIDQLGFFAVGAIALYAVLTSQPVLLSVGIVMALILFLGTAAFAMFIERRARAS